MIERPAATMRSWKASHSKNMVPGIDDTRACPDCGRPQHYTGIELGWCHDATVDTWDCADPRKAGA